MEGESFEDFLARRKAAQAEVSAPVEVLPEWDTLPDFEEYDGPDELEQVVRSIGIVEAYMRWCGKMTPNVGSKRESIMVSCPNPSHPDANPSAWLNTDKNVGNCGSCGGFDVIDVFAWSEGYSVPQYRNASFREVKIKMAEALGFVQKRTISGEPYVERIEEPVSNIKSINSVQPGPSDPDAEDEEFDVNDLDDTEYSVEPIDWQNLLTGSSRFLLPWMETVTIDMQPEEFYFWLGMQALGIMGGRKAVLNDFEPVKGNLLVCLMGGSGMGKTRTMRKLTDLMIQALPYDTANPSAGVKLVSSPGSGEALVDQFSHVEVDPTTNQQIVYPIRGLLKMNEMSELIGKAARSGSILKSKVIEMFDGDPQTLASRSKGVVVASDYFFSLVTSVQPGVMGQLIQKEDLVSGFMNRWVFVPGIRKETPVVGGVRVDVAPLVPMVQAINAWASLGRNLDFESAALIQFVTFIKEDVRPLVFAEGNDILQRAELLLKKMCLLLAIDKLEREVSYETVTQVMALWPFVLNGFGISAQHSKPKEKDAIECDGKIMRLLDLLPDDAWVTGRDVVNRLRKSFSSEDIKRSLKNLTELGVVEASSTRHAGAGRPTERYRSTRTRTRALATVTKIS
jgi:hypothetical protein